MKPYNEMADYDEVIPRLYMGGAVYPTKALETFSMVVLCAKEHQPALSGYEGAIVNAPFEDAGRTQAEEPALLAASIASAAFSAGDTVLISCSAGLNRSGLVVGMVMNRETVFSISEILIMIRDARGPLALNNRWFQELLRDHHKTCRRMY